MIPFPGKLVVRFIKGRKGSFAVGELISEIGSFKVKDPFLDQFEEGEYHGSFVVQRIYPDSYVYYGRVVTEIRAQIFSYSLHEETQAPAESLPPEPDPADIPSNSGSETISTVDVSTGSNAPASSATPLSAETSGNPDSILFGNELLEIIAAIQSVKLDPTIERNKFRAQRDRLKELGYRFEASTQIWTHVDQVMQ